MPGIPMFIAFVCTPWAGTISIFVMPGMFCILGIFDKFAIFDMFMLDMLDMFGMVDMVGIFDMFAIGAPGCGSGIVIGGSSFIHAFSSMLVHFPLVPAWLCFRC